MSLIDPFISPMATLIHNFSVTNSLGWNVVIQNSPNRKETDVVPMVILAPSQKTQVGYIAFQQVKTINSYDCYLLDSGDLASDFSNASSVFFNALRGLFMPQVAAMTNAGAYMCRLAPKYDYDRSAFPKGWSSSCVEINVFYVN